jgi:hypothetical protein
MNSKLDQFKVNESYSNEEISKSLRVSNAGGVRFCLENGAIVRRMAIMTSTTPSRLHKENPYHDRVEGDTLVYTGVGREGDQTLSGVNQRFPQQVIDRFPIYLFSKFASRRDKRVGPKRWRFLGLLEYLRHYQETQFDVRGSSRIVWLFEFLIHQNPTLIPLEFDSAISREICEKTDADDVESRDDRQVEELATFDQQATCTLSASESSALRTRLLAFSPQEFEHVIKSVLLRTGFQRVNVTKYSQDGGIDVNAYPNDNLWPLRELLVQIQAKRWLHTVGRREVAELRGSLEPYARGVVVTTSHFSKAAITEAHAPGKNPIGLIDGNQFGAIVATIEQNFLDNLILNSHELKGV